MAENIVHSISKKNVGKRLFSHLEPFKWFGSWTSWRYLVSFNYIMNNPVVKYEHELATDNLVKRIRQVSQLNAKMKLWLVWTLIAWIWWDTHMNSAIHIVKL